MKLVQAFNKLQPRERLGATIAAAAVLYVLLDFALIGPEEKARKALTTQIAAHREELVTLKAEMTVAEAQLAQDPQAKNREQLEQFRKVTAEAASFLANADKNPRQVGDLLRQVLAATPGLTLVSLKTLPVVALHQAPPPPPPPSAAAQLLESKGKLEPAAKPGKAAPKAAPTLSTQGSVYRHGVEITVRGNYLSLLPYLQQLESQRLLWAEAQLQVASYPDSTLRLTIYTLGTQQGGVLTG
jgi:MSHA biogenesis protein MshJ